MVLQGNKSKIFSGREYTVGATREIKHCFHMNAVTAM